MLAPIHRQVSDSPASVGISEMIARPSAKPRDWRDRLATRWAATVYLILVSCLFGHSNALAQPDASLNDSRGEDLARWIDLRGQQVWGTPPKRCDDLTFMRRVYLDLLGRIPSVSEVRDFESLPDDRRTSLVDSIVFGEGERAAQHRRLGAQQLARQWRNVLIPPTTNTVAPVQGIETWLAAEFKQRVPYDQLMGKLVSMDQGSAAQQYFQATGALPENYAGNVSRALLGVRIECAQCHDHPFTDWRQEDFWGLAAFYSDVPSMTSNDPAAAAAAQAGKITHDGMQYEAKYLWNDQPVQDLSTQLRESFSRWLTSGDNPQFSATAVNRFWQHLIGRGLYADVENLDQASPEQRAFLDELGGRFAESGFQTDTLIAAICKSSWYQAESHTSTDVAGPLDNTSEFTRPLKSASPEQIFDSMEQSLLLSISRIDDASPRYSGQRGQLIARLSEAVGASPEDYVSGIPQALLLMNGRLTSEAIDAKTGRLLRAVVDAPFFNDEQQLEVLYLAVLTRRPTEQELSALGGYLSSRTAEQRPDAMGEVLWALLNSPEFVLCR